MPQTTGSSEVRCCRGLSCRERTSDRIARASLEAAIFREWPVPATSKESETRSLRDSGRPRGPTQLAADVRDVTVNGVPAKQQLLCDLAVAETARDAGEDLTLTTGQQNPLRLARIVRRRLPRCQRFAARADDGIDITVPGEVRAPLQRDKRRARNRGRDLTPKPERHRAVVATMHNQRRPADEGKLRANVEAVDQPKQGGGPREEHVTEQARAESPMRAYRRENRIGHTRSSNRCAVGVRPVQHQALHALRKCCGKGDRGAAPA